MLYARIVERGNRHILLTTDIDESEAGKYSVIFETNYQGDYFVSFSLGGYDTRQQAYDSMVKLTDNEIMTHVMNVIEAIAEDEGQ